MKRLFIWIIFVASVLLSINLARSVFDLTKRDVVIQEVKNELSEAEEKNIKLQQELEYVNSPAFIEQQARDKLNMARPGETVLIIPEVVPPPDEKPSKVLPIWRQWMEVFGMTQ